MVLNLQRLGSVTSELSSHLIRSIALPGELLRQLPRRRRSRRPGGPEESGLQAALPAGAILWVGSDAIPDDAVVAALRRAGGRQELVAAIGAGEAGAAMAPAALRQFVRYGARVAGEFPVRSRAEAGDPSWSERLRGARVAILCAGDAREARDLLLASPCQAALREVLAAGGVVLGIGEGGTALGSQFLALGPEGRPQLEEGLGLMPPLLLPAALSLRRCGPGQLLAALGIRLGREHLGLAVDAGAAVLLAEDEVRVLGEGAVIVLDGRDALPGPVDSFRTPVEVPVAADDPPALDLRAHVLLAGYGLNLRSRRPLGPPRPPLQAAGD
ncbi:MAG: hypothetical protein L6E13_00870 [Firmicutes bacterium]|nr:hypothetical protein [Bacillota bacterium]